MLSGMRGRGFIVKRMALVLVASVALVGVMATSGVAAPGPPTVVKVSPSDGFTKALPDTILVAFFSEQMQASSINTDTFRLLKNSPDGTSTPVPATLKHIVAAQKAWLYPSAPLTPGDYTATITSEARDLEGNSLDQNPDSTLTEPKVWRFTVADKPADPTPLTVIDWSPPGSSRPAPAAVNVTATFSERVRPATVNATTFKLYKMSSGTATPVSAAVAYDAATKTATLDPTADLEPGAYRFTVAPSVRDLAGYQLDQSPAYPGREFFSWWFKVTDAPIPADTMPPTVRFMSPSIEDAQAYPSNLPLRAAFSEDMHSASINSTTVTLTKDGVEPIPVKIAYDLSNRDMTMDPVADLEPGQYTFRVTKFVRDLAGNQLDQDPALPGNQSRGRTFTVVDSTP